MHLKSKMISLIALLSQCVVQTQTQSYINTSSTIIMFCLSKVARKPPNQHEVPLIILVFPLACCFSCLILHQSSSYICYHWPCRLYIDGYENGYRFGYGDEKRQYFEILEMVRLPVVVCLHP